MKNFIRPNGTIGVIDENKSPSNFKQLLGFLICNRGRDCFSKFQGKVWMITKAGKWKEVCRNIGDLTFIDYLNLCTND